jgi:uncharacterized phage protein (TIGR01671 family)
MTTQIKFRGKQSDWEYGGYSNCFGEHQIINDSGSYAVDENSVGQFIGIQDRNGKDIYKGDVVNYAVKRKICPDCAKKEHSSELKYGISKFCPDCGKVITETDFITTCEVVFDKGGFAYRRQNNETYYQSWQTHVAEIYLAWVEVVGNLTDNPELIHQVNLKQNT